MAWKYPLLDRIAAGSDRGLTEHPSVQRAIGVAWDTADPAGRRKIIAALLQNRQPENLVTLIQRLHELDPGSRAELVQRMDQLQKPLRIVLSGSNASQSPDAQINALILIEAAAAGSLAYLVTEKLRSPHDEVRRQAEAGLLGLVGQADSMSDVDSRRLIEAVNAAVVRYASHRRPAVLRAWLGLAPRGLVAGGASLDALQDTDHAAVGPMRDLLKAAEHPLDRAGLVAALSIPPLTLAAVAGLRRCIEKETWGEAIAGREHLLDWAAVRRGLARAGEPGALLPDTWDDAPGAAVAALPAWIAALPMPPLDQAAQLRRLSDAATPLPARFAACRRLITLVDQADINVTASPDPRLIAQVQQQLTDRVDDQNASLARLAAAWLLGQNTDDNHAAALAAISQSRHSPVKAMASRRLRATAFDRLWDAWPNMNDTARLQAARTALKLDPLAAQRLEAKLRRGGRPRSQALEIVTCIPKPHAHGHATTTVGAAAATVPGDAT